MINGSKLFTQMIVLQTEDAETAPLYLLQILVKLQFFNVLNVSKSQEKGANC